ncbi:MAG: M28 family peptidase [Bacteroidales bacterium]|nr:M28 family peptidase [Bacteroidales bacterium]
MKKFALSILFLLTASLLFSQVLSKYEQKLYRGKQQEILSHIADDMAQGRASGTIGKQAIEQYIVRRFREYGLKPYNWHYIQSARYNDSIITRNVVGVIPAAVPTDKYVVIGAHYDHIGEINGIIYNGADDNASGVTALINLAEMFSAMKKDGNGPGKNIIFVAFDGKEFNMCGSDHFVKNLPFPARNITCMVNMDMIGTDLEPVGFRREYLIALGEERLDPKYRGILGYLSRSKKYEMDLDLTYYGSKDFTRLFYRMSDQHSFAKAGIPALLFTSGIHKHTYKPSDLPEIINYDVLRKRTLLIFNFIFRVCEY